MLHVLSVKFDEINLLKLRWNLKAKDRTDPHLAAPWIL